MREIRAALGIAEADLRAQVKSGVLVGNLVIGILFVLLLTLVFGLGSVPRHLPIAVYVPGQTPNISQSEFFSPYVATSERQVRDDVRAGRAAAGFIVQPDGKHAVIVTDDTNGLPIANQIRLAAQLIDSQEAFTTPADVVVSVEHLYGVDVSSQVDNLRLVMALLLPVMVFVFGCVMVGESLLVERDRGNLYELAMAPVGTAWIVAGKLLGALANLVLVIGIVLAISFFAFSVRPNGDLLAELAAAVLLGLGTVSLTYALSSLFPSTEVYRGFISMLVVLPMTFLSGAFFPVQGLPGFLQSAASWLPLTWAVRVAREVTFRQAGFDQTALDLRALTLFFVVALVLGPLALRRSLRASLSR